MSRFQVGDEVAVDFSGRVTEIREGYDRKLIYKVESPDNRELCLVFECAVLPLPKSEEDFKEVKE